MVNILPTTGAIAELDTIDLDFLRNMADNGIGLASYQSRAILCFFYGECINHNIEIPLQTKSKIIEQNNNSTLAERIHIYPNPAHQYVAIELPISQKNIDITIYDINGQLVFKQSVMKPIYIWDTQLISNGTYIIKVIIQNGEELTQKVVIQH
ncbi:MAG: T9SS type A sorting domain-containing protein [Crocinitomicaceae bacterium]